MFGRRENPEQRMYQQGMDQDRMNSMLQYSADTEAAEQYMIPDKEAKDDLTKWQQDLKKKIDMIKHKLRREIKIGDTWKRPKGVQPMMNEIGIGMFDVAVDPFTDVNLMMSNYDTQQIYCSLRGTALDFVSTLVFNYKLYEINKGDLTQILRLFRGFVEPTHWRCLNNGERRFLTTISRRVETFADQADPKKKANAFDVKWS